MKEKIKNLDKKTVIFSLLSFFMIIISIPESNNTVSEFVHSRELFSASVSFGLISFLSNLSSIFSYYLSLIIYSVCFVFIVFFIKNFLPDSNEKKNSFNEKILFFLIIFPLSFSVFFTKKLFSVSISLMLLSFELFIYFICKNKYKQALAINILISVINPIAALIILPFFTVIFYDKTYSKKNNKFFFILSSIILLAVFIINLTKWFRPLEKFNKYFFVVFVLFLPIFIFFFYIFLSAYKKEKQNKLLYVLILIQPVFSFSLLFSTSSAFIWFTSVTLCYSASLLYLSRKNDYICNLISNKFNSIKSRFIIIFYSAIYFSVLNSYGFICDFIFYNIL